MDWRYAIEPNGEGDILSLGDTRNCLLEDYQAGLDMNLEAPIAQRGKHRA